LENFKILMNIDTKLSDVVFCALDLETTGVNPAFNRIIEIGMIRFTLDTEFSVFNRLVNPGTGIPEQATFIHGITDEMVKDADTIDTMLDDVTEFLSDSFLVIQNPGFDLSFLDCSYRISGKSTPDLQSFDTVRMSQASFPDLTNHKLNTLCSYLKIDLKHHRALSDAYGCMEVFRSIIKKNDPLAKWRIRDLMDFHGDLVKPSITLTSVKGQKIVRGLVIGKVAQIKYADSEGTVTVRKITPKEVIKYGKNQYVLAHCYL